MRSTPALDARLRDRLQQAVKMHASGSADKFGQLVGYANGGYIREIINGRKPVREALIERVHSTQGLAGWFTELLTPAMAVRVEARPAPRWPFDGITPKEWSESLTERERGVVEQAARDAMNRIRADKEERSSNARGPSRKPRASGR